MMKFTKIAAAAVAVSTMAGSAFAADLPSRKVPMIEPPPPVATWTGFYFGLNAGYTWSQSSAVTAVSAPIFVNPLFPAGSGAISGSLAQFGTGAFALGGSNGFIGGGQIGYNHQWGSVVAGLEVDIAGIASSRRAAAAPYFATLAQFGFPAESWSGVTGASKKIDNLGTVRGRLGYLFTPTLLLYATGGLAYADVSVRYAIAGQESLGPGTYPPLIGGAALRATRVGYTVGGGLEWMFLPNWSLKGEYLYYDLGSVSQRFGLSQQDVGIGLWGATAGVVRTSFSGHVVRAGINYHLNWFNAAPVVARY